MSSKKKVLSTSNEHLGGQSELSFSFNNVSLSKVTLRGQKQKKLCLSTVTEDVSGQKHSGSESSDGAKAVDSTDVVVVNKANNYDAIDKKHKKRSYSLTQSHNNNEICSEDQQPPEKRKEKLSLFHIATNKNKEKCRTDQKSVFDSVGETVTTISWEGKSEPEADDVPVKQRKKKLKEIEVHQTLESESGNFDNIKNKLPEKSKHRHKKVVENLNKEEGSLDKEPVLIGNKLPEDITDLELKNTTLLKGKIKKNSKQNCSGSGFVKSRGLCEVESSVGDDPKSKLSLSLTNKHKQESSVVCKDQPHNTSDLYLAEGVSCSTKDLVKSSDGTYKHSPDFKRSAKRKSQEYSLKNVQVVKPSEICIVDENPKKERKPSLLIVNESKDKIVVNNKDNSTQANKNGLMISNTLGIIDKIKQELIASAFKSINKPKEHRSPMKSKIKINHSEPQEIFIKKGETEDSKSVRTKRKNRIKPYSKALDSCLSQDMENDESASCNRPRKQLLDGSARKICVPNKIVKRKPKLDSVSKHGIETIQKELLESAFKKMSTTESIKTQFELHKSLTKTRGKETQKDIASINNNSTKLRKTNEGLFKVSNKKKGKVKAFDTEKVPTTMQKEVLVLTNNASCTNQVSKNHKGEKNNTKKKKSKVKTIDPFEEIMSKMLSEELKKRKQYCNDVKQKRRREEELDEEDMKLYQKQKEAQKALAEAKPKAAPKGPSVGGTIKQSGKK